MPKVKVLNRETAELIAAGEVIERPASVIKELIENAVDSGADSITVEIKNGGITYIRVTDNGCGIEPDDVPTVFLRHATSKISSKDDLDGIITLGFRGEALASICAVAKVEVLTKTSGTEYGVRYSIEGSVQTSNERCGCSVGTTFIIRDMFFNVPARLKFLKKDVAEGNAVADITAKIAISHPEISFKFIRDNRQEIITPGNGDLYSSVYAVMGKQFAASLIPVDYELNGIKIDGYTVKPLFGKPKRTFQFFFINGRYIKSIICIQALEEAYKNSIMEGKFPACVLRMTLPPNMLDVNVHPAKIEVRFTDEHVIRDAVFFSVKNAILLDSAPSELKLPERKPTADDYMRPTAFDAPDRYTQISLKDNNTNQEIINNSPTTLTEDNVNNLINENVLANSSKNIINTEHENNSEIPIENLADSAEDVEYKYITNASFVKNENINIGNYKDNLQDEKKNDLSFRIIGEAFKNYIITEIDDEIIFTDKHAAHERILFENLKSGIRTLECQLLMNPETVTLTLDEIDILKENIILIEEMGFAFEIISANTVSVCGVPSLLDGLNPGNLLAETARNICEHRNNPMPEIVDEIYHTIACKAAIKANDITSPREMEELVRMLFENDNIRYCPHGRPVMFKLTKRELEKQFKRIL